MKSIVSLEFDRGFIRAAEIEKPDSAKPAVVRYSELPIDPAVVGDSEIFDIDLATEGLKTLWAEGEFKSKVVNLAFANRRIIVRDYEAPYIDLADIRANLGYEAAELLPSQMENSILDFYPIEKVERNGIDKIRGLIIATAAEPVENIILATHLAGLTTEFVDLMPFGLARALRAHVKPEEEYLIVNVTPDSSDVVAVRDGSPQMVRVIPNGIPARGIGARGKHAAAESSVMVNIDNENKVTPEESFVRALRTTIEFYENKGGRVDKIYLTGDGSLSQEIIEKIFMYLGKPSERVTLHHLIASKVEDSDPVIEASLTALVASALRNKNTLKNNSK